MKKNLSRASILEKKEILEKTKTQLKKEFIGIDTIIDEVIESLTSWYLFPEIQERPVVVNLWGLTGVGKSSLIKRIAELLNFKERFFHFDLGEAGHVNWGIKSKLLELFEHENGFPVILALDEFQLSRGIDESGKELDRSVLKIVWEILDSGKFQATQYSHELEDLFDYTSKLRQLLRMGVKVKNGIVISRRKFFFDQIGRSRHFPGRTKLPKEVPFVHPDQYRMIRSLAREKYPTEFHVEEELKKLDGPQTIKFLSKVYQFGISPRIVDCSRAIVFVLGNLDEAYRMSNDFNPDMNADEFHEKSKKINVTEVKIALKARFRNEQIARLGNNHIIYPTFSSDSFRKIIRLELEKTGRKIFEQEGIKLQFDDSLVDLIYKEGVFPTQGTRPVFTTINQLMGSRLGRILCEMFNCGFRADEIKISSENNKIIFSYFFRNKPVHRLEETPVLRMEELRKERKDDLQAIIAVHESGHAIAEMVLMKNLPEIIYSVTADSESEGFVHSRKKWKYTSKEEVLHRLAIGFGGLAAERLVFGDKKITAGAGSDIRNATSLASEVIKKTGMGSVNASFHIPNPNTNDYVYDISGEVNAEIKKLLSAGYELAEEVLKKEYKLLIKMADYLSDNRFMGKEQIRTFLDKYGKSVKSADMIEKGDHLFYREHLKMKARSLDSNETVVESLPATVDFTLNHDNYEGK